MNVNDFAIVVVPLPESEGGGFAAHVPDLPGCMSDGQTQGEAVENAHDAIECWIAAALDMGRKIPEPGNSVAKMREKDGALLAALSAALNYADHIDGEMAALEAKVQTLIRLMRDDASSQPRISDAAMAARIASPAACH